MSVRGGRREQRSVAKRALYRCVGCRCALRLARVAPPSLLIARRESQSRATRSTSSGATATRATLVNLDTERRCGGCRKGKACARSVRDSVVLLSQGLPAATAARDHDFFGIAERHTGALPAPLADAPHPSGRGAGIHAPHSFSLVAVAAGGGGGGSRPGASVGGGAPPDPAPSPPRATGIPGSSNRFASAANPNAGNSLTDRPITRISRPPGGGSSVILG